jgi:pilus assembly protein CpaF
MERAWADLWPPGEMRAWIVDQLSKSGRSWDAKYPFADSLLTSGHRLHAVFPPIAGESPAVSLRRTALCGNAPDIQEAWKQQMGYSLLREAVLEHESILVAGATGSGKTTLLNTLVSEVPPSERLLLLEDVPELKPRHPHSLRLCARPASADGAGEVTLRTLVRQSLRMRPDRLIIGECRGPEVLDLLQALNTGHRGTLATVHAASARDALRRLELLCLLSPGQPLVVPVIRDLIASSIQWVVHLERTFQGRQIRELARVAGREGDTILLRPMLASSHGSHGPERTALVNASRGPLPREVGPSRLS